MSVRKWREGTHPDLIKAFTQFDAGNPGPLIALSLRSADRYCECADPITSGLDLMCQRCCHRNAKQERARVEWVNSPHPFEPGAETGLKAAFCARCVRLEDDPRHAGADRG